jgi:hypothetical protein
MAFWRQHICDFERTCHMLGIALTPDQFNACCALELRFGMKFCVDFGYQNAVCKAMALGVKF